MEGELAGLRSLRHFQLDGRKFLNAVSPDLESLLIPGGECFTASFQFPSKRRGIRWIVFEARDHDFEFSRFTGPPIPARRVEQQYRRSIVFSEFLRANSFGSMEHVDHAFGAVRIVLEKPDRGAAQAR